jgi:hypothetical protein
MLISELEWHFDLPFWNTPQGYYDLTPNEVLNNPREHKEEFERINNADMRYPLDIMFWKNKWVLLDGLHRLAKAKVQKMDKVKVRKISQKHIHLLKLNYYVMYYVIKLHTKLLMGSIRIISAAQNYT